MTTLAINGAHAARLLEALDERDETAWVLTAAVMKGGELLLGRELLEVPADAYVERGPTRLRIASTGFVPAFSRARSEGHVAVFVHTHPGGLATPSLPDAEVDRVLRAHARDRGLVGYASLVVGGVSAQPAVAGSVWVDDAGPTSIGKVRVAGSDMCVWLADGQDLGGPLPIFDRQVRAFGPDGQRLLSGLRVGVVGAGGTGSATIEQLARLGVGELVVVDDDVVDEANLTRIHESSHDDIDVPKVDLAKRRAESFGTGTRVRAVRGTVASRVGVDALAGCDVIFGCTDDNAGRLVLNRIAYRYLIPVLDSAVVIDADGGAGVLRGVTGRVTVVVPGEPCLLCRGQVDASLASEEMMDPAARRALSGEGYARGATGPAPAVVSFTTAVAALAVSEWLGRLLGYAESTSSQLLVRFHGQEIRRAGRPAVPGHMCVEPAEWALGATEPPLGIVGLR